MKKTNADSSRQRYHQKKQTKKMIISLIIAVIIVLSFLFFKTGQQHTPIIAEIGGPKVKVKAVAESPTRETTSSTAVTQQELEIKTNEPNVKRAFQNPSWHVVPTDQKEPHSINLEDDSLDRQEINVAITMATELQSDDLIEWWLTGAGENRINATVSNLNKDQIYTVYLAWIKDRGWLVEQVDELKSLPDFQKN